MLFSLKHLPTSTRLSGSEVPHRTVIPDLYQAPALKEKKLLRWRTASWQICLLTTFQGGKPFTVVAAANTNRRSPVGLAPQLSLRRALHLRQLPAIRHSHRRHAAKEFSITERYKMERRGEF